MFDDDDEDDDEKAIPKTASNGCGQKVYINYYFFGSISICHFGTVLLCQSVEFSIEVPKFLQNGWNQWLFQYKEKCLVANQESMKILKTNGKR